MTLAQIDALSQVHTKVMGGKEREEGTVGDLLALKAAATRG